MIWICKPCERGEHEGCANDYAPHPFICHCTDGVCGEEDWGHPSPEAVRENWGTSGAWPRAEELE